VRIFSNKTFTIKGMSNITGGGIYEKLPRMLPEGIKAEVKTSSWAPPAIFKLIADAGKIPSRDMYNTFNMGVGMDVIVPAEQADAALRILKECGEDAYIVGEVKESEEKICLI
jgi:phosphoribosylformylglycinamidine cyclo-ligase